MAEVVIGRGQPVDVSPDTITQEQAIEEMRLLRERIAQPFITEAVEQVEIVPPPPAPSPDLRAGR